MNKKAVVLLSGGLDSTTLLYKLKKEGWDCYPISIDYGQKHSRELQAAGLVVCEDVDWCSRWKVVDLSEQLKDLLPSALTTDEVEIPKGHYADKSMKATVVPNRNMILLSIAAGYALGLSAQVVAYAAHSGDHPIYPDCRPEFIEAIRKAVWLGTESIGLITPFMLYSKAMIVEEGSRLGVPYEKTYSCYVGGIKHCGLCGTCVERRLSFIEASIEDPTVYEKEQIC